MGIDRYAQRVLDGDDSGDELRLADEVLARGERIKALEAERDRMREALKEIAATLTHKEVSDWEKGVGIKSQKQAHALADVRVGRLRDIARRTLAELEGNHV